MKTQKKSARSRGQGVAVALRESLPHEQSGMQIGRSIEQGVPVPFSIKAMFPLNHRLLFAESHEPDASASRLPLGE